MSPSSPTRVVATDATVLINLTHVGRLDLLSALSAFSFVVPDQGVAEITVPDQRQQFQEALARGDLRQESITDPRELAIYAELRRTMGKGEAACLATAHFIANKRQNSIGEKPTEKEILDSVMEWNR